ncbi:MAG: mobile mystery protein B [Bacteroidia bacterium]
MGLEDKFTDGKTLLGEEETEGLLINTITTHGELDELEQLNIESAIEWTLIKKFKPESILTEKFVKELHKRMFGNIWSWAGNFRKTEKNIGIKFHLIGTELKQLNDDCIFWIKNQTYTDDEIAIRYKHRIVQIHCFPNGNGRHSRLMADVMRRHIFRKPAFEWGNGINYERPEDQRKSYLKAIREADKGKIKPLINFANGKK